VPAFMADLDVHNLKILEIRIWHRQAVGVPSRLRCYKQSSYPSSGRSIGPGSRRLVPAGNVTESVFKTVK